MKRRARTSFSLVEIAISVAILAVLMIAVFSLLVSSQEATLTTANEVDLDSIAREAGRNIRRELRQSGWEVELAGSNVWDGNMVPLLVPSDSTSTTFGTAANSAATEIVFRKRVGFDLGTPVEDYDWTNDGATPPNKRFIRYVRFVDNELGNYRNIPGGQVPRYRLVRQEGTSDTGPWTTVGFQVKNLENVTFWRENYDTVTVKLEFMLAHPVGHGRATPEPIRRKLTERIQLLNGSNNGV